MPVLSSIDPRTTLVDLQYLGQDHYIASCLLESDDGVAVVDPGPTVCLPALRDGLAMRGRSIADVRWVLLTHIHLDHGGVSGTLVRENPAISVYAHERGAPHLEHPARLLESATRIYGDKMDTMWGEFVPVPAANVRALAGGETLDLGGRAVEVAYTPGHAWHHVSYLDRSTGTAFVGDTAGERMPGTPVMATTPPPDIDLEAWKESLAQIRAWEPTRLFLTHFGPVENVAEYLDAHDAALGDWAEQVRVSLDEPGTDEERAARFADRETDQLLAASTEEGRPNIHWDSTRDCWYGLARYWRKHAR